MSLRKKAIHGVTWSAIENVGKQLISFFVFLILARLLNPESFGLIAMAGVAIAFLGLMVNYGFGPAIVQRAELDPEHLDTAFWVGMSANVLLTIIALLSADWIAALFSQPLLGSIIRWLSIPFIVGSLTTVQMALLRRNMAFKSLAIRSSVSGIIGGIVAIIMALNGFGVWSLVGRQLVTSLATVLLLWWVCDWRPGLKFSIKHFKDLFGFGFALMGTNVVEFFTRQSDNLLIGYFLGPVALGYYAIGYRLVYLMTEFLGGTVNNVAWPVFARLQKESDRMKSIFYKAIQTVALFTFPAFLGIFALAPEIVPMFFGVKWSPSIPIMQVLAFVGIVNAISFMNDSVIVAMGRSNWYFALEASIAAFNVVGFLIAVHFGIVAVAASYVIVRFIFMPVSLIMVRKLIGVNLIAYLKQLQGIVVASAIMVVSIFAAKGFGIDLNSLLFQLLVFVTMGAFIYFVAIWFLSPILARQTIDLVRLMLPSKVGKPQELGGE